MAIMINGHNRRYKMITTPESSLSTFTLAIPAPSHSSRHFFSLWAPDCTKKRGYLPMVILLPLATWAESTVLSLCLDTI